jgi:ferrochelatase
MVHGRALARDLAEVLGPAAVVRLAMRCGRPSIEEGLDRFRRQGVDRVVVFPLYPQYASSTTGSIVEEVYRQGGRMWNTPFLHIVQPFYDHPAFLDAVAEVGRPVLEQVNPDFVLFSYHGLPERQIRMGDDTGDRCLTRDDCCDRIWEGNRNCYRAQCFATSRGLKQRLGLSEGSTATTFQSRFGRTPWITPYTDREIESLAARGVRRLAVFCPAFVADCLETLEEIGIRGRESFRAAGGDELTLVPAVNSTPVWTRAVARILRDSTSWLAIARDPSAGPAAGEAGRR